MQNHTTATELPAKRCFAGRFAHRDFALFFTKTTEIPDLVGCDPNRRETPNREPSMMSLHNLPPTYSAVCRPRSSRRCRLPSPSCMGGYALEPTFLGAGTGPPYLHGIPAEVVQQMAGIPLESGHEHVWPFRSGVAGFHLCSLDARLAGFVLRAGGQPFQER